MPTIRELLNANLQPPTGWETSDLPLDQVMQLAVAIAEDMLPMADPLGIDAEATTESVDHDSDSSTVSIGGRRYRLEPGKRIARLCSTVGCPSGRIGTWPGLEVCAEHISEPGPGAYEDWDRMRILVKETEHNVAQSVEAHAAAEALYATIHQPTARELEERRIQRVLASGRGDHGHDAY